MRGSGAAVGRIEAAVIIIRSDKDEPGLGVSLLEEQHGRERGDLDV